MEERKKLQICKDIRLSKYLSWMNYHFKLIHKKYSNSKRVVEKTLDVSLCLALASVMMMLETVIYSAVGPHNEQHMLKGGE